MTWSGVSFWTDAAAEAVAVEVGCTVAPPPHAPKRIAAAARAARYRRITTPPARGRPQTANDHTIGPTEVTLFLCRPSSRRDASGAIIEGSEAASRGSP